MEQESFKCDFCSYKDLNGKKVIVHMLGKHRGEGNFSIKCVVPSCMYRTRTWAAFKQHCKRKHNFLLNSSSVSQYLHQDDLSDTEGLVEDGQDQIELDLSLMTAKYVLSLEAGNKVSNVAIDKIVSSTRDYIIDQQKEMRRKIARISGIAPFMQDIDKIMESQNVITSFQTVRSKQCRNSAYRNNFSFIPPKKCILGSKYVTGEGGAKRLVKKFGYYVPLQSLIKSLVEILQIQNFLSKESEYQEDFMRDVSDGDYLRSHPMSKGEGWFMKLAMSHDDVEIQNPLRSNKSHKLGMFYISVLNIPPQYRSQLHTIFLLAIGKSKDIKTFGLEQILHDFISTMKLLRREGMKVQVNERTVSLRADLVFAVCDGPAAAFLGGFKESAFALKCCRMCRCTAQEMKKIFSSCALAYRDMLTYNEQCNVLENPHLRRARSYWSKMYGINKRSVLSDISFPVTENLIQDPMHCLLEGVYGQELALFLNRLVIVLDMVSLNWVNDKLRSFQYLFSDCANVPNEIEKGQITLPKMFIKQKASVILTLVYVMPIILGEVIDTSDPYYRNFLGCTKIVVSSFSPFADKTTAGELEVLIHSYLKNFVELYPHITFKPKMHYMLHLPRQLIMFGPLRQQNCMRFEAKHGWFKDYRWKNFVNLPYSLSEKHQLYLADLMTDSSGRPKNNFIYQGDIVKEGRVVRSAELQDEIIDGLPDVFNDENEFYLTKEVQVDCIKYVAGAGILLSEDDIEGPHFASINEIVCRADRKYVILNVLTTLDYVEKFNAYLVSRDEESVEVLVKDIKELKFKWTLPIYRKCEENFLITNRCSVKVMPY